MVNRRSFLKQTLLGATGLAFAPSFTAQATGSGLEISLAEWSLHRTLQAGRLDNLDFPLRAKKDFDISVVEYVNGFFGGKKMNFKEAGKSSAYLNELLQRSKDAGVINHLIMVDEEGPLAVPK